MHGCTTAGSGKPTSAHELFHKMQYAYGYKTRWKPKEPYLWFTEGTAAWSEVFVWGRVSRTCKVDTLFKNTKLGLYQADDMAMPFWIYCVRGNHPNPNNEFIVKLFEKCEQLRDVRLALNEAIKETYGSVDDFFKSFARDRNNGFWADTCYGSVQLHPGAGRKRPGQRGQGYSERTQELIGGPG